MSALREALWAAKQALRLLREPLIPQDRKELW